MIATRRLLIADADGASRRALSEWFRRRGYGVEAAADGEAAWERLRAAWEGEDDGLSAPGSRLDLAILDYELPHGGAEVPLARAREEGITIPVILVTSRPLDRLAHAAEVLSEIAGVFAKPLAARRIEAAVEAIFARRLPVPVPRALPEGVVVVVQRSGAALAGETERRRRRMES